MTSKIVISKILIAAGGTEEPIDEVRSVTNLSTGRFGMELAEGFLEAGSQVTLLLGKQANLADTLQGYCDSGQLLVRRFGGYQSLLVLMREELSPRSNFNIGPYDAILMAAAIADYSPLRVAGKLSSDVDELSIRMLQNAKILSMLRSLAPRPTKLVGFKLLVGDTEETLIKAAREQISRCQLDLVVANDLKAIRESGGASHPVTLVFPLEDSCDSQSDVRVEDSADSRCDMHRRSSDCRPVSSFSDSIERLVGLRSQVAREVAMTVGELIAGESKAVCAAPVETVAGLSQSDVASLLAKAFDEMGVVLSRECGVPRLIGAAMSAETLAFTEASTVASVGAIEPEVRDTENRSVSRSENRGLAEELLGVLPSSHVIRTIADNNIFILPELFTVCGAGDELSSALDGGLLVWPGLVGLDGPADIGNAVRRADRIALACHTPPRYCFRSGGGIHLFALDTWQASQVEESLQQALADLSRLLVQLDADDALKARLDFPERILDGLYSIRVIVAEGRMVGVLVTLLGCYHVPYIFPSRSGRGYGTRVLNALVAANPSGSNYLILPRSLSRSFALERGWRDSYVGESGVVYTSPLAQSPSAIDGLIDAASVCLFHLASRSVLVGERLKEPLAGRYAFPGGKLRPGESDLQAGLRELAEETGVTLAGRLPCFRSTHFLGVSCNSVSGADKSAGVCGQMGEAHRNCGSDSYCVYRVQNVVYTVDSPLRSRDSAEMCCHWTKLEEAVALPLARGTRQVVCGLIGSRR